MAQTRTICSVFPTRPRSRRDGFSLLELVMVLGLIALLATLSVINLGNVYDTADSAATEDLLAMAVREARYRAVLEKVPVLLRFDGERGVFTVNENSGRLLAEIATDHHPTDYPISVRFQIPLPERGAPLGMDSISEGELTVVDSVVFGPDLVANPFVAEIDEASTIRRFRFDPFSNVRIRSDEASR